MPTKSTKSLWRKQESRAVRPFRSATEYLAEVAIRLNGDHDFTEADSIRLDGIDRSALQIAIRVPALPEDFSSIVDVPADLLRLVVALEDRFLKRTLVLHSEAVPVGGESARVIELDPDDIREFSWAGSVSLHVAVLLRTDRPGLVGVAHRTGSWVAKKSFTIGRPTDVASFPIEPTPPAVFQALGLPDSTTYFIELVDSDLDQPCDLLPTLLRVRVAENVHAALARDESSAAAKALTRALYVDIVTTVLTAGYRDLSGEPSAGSILAVVTDRLAKGSGIPSDAIMKLAKDTSGPSYIRALVQAESDLTRAFVAATQRRPA